MIGFGDEYNLVYADSIQSMAECTIQIPSSIGIPVSKEWEPFQRLLFILRYVEIHTQLKCVKPMLFSCFPGI